MILLLLVKFLVGGSLVVAFALICDMIHPHYAAGIFAAAPSIALASLGIGFISEGGVTVQQEAIGMAVGACAMIVYVLVAEPTIKRTNSLVGSLATIVIWLAVGIGGYFVVYGGLV